MPSSEISQSEISSRNWIWLSLICLGCVVLMSGLPVPQGYDITQHLRFAASYREAILDGSFIPGWAGVDNLGYGSVGVRFYPPLADFILAVTHIFTNDWYLAFLINSFFWMFPGCIGVYFWVKEFRTPKYAALAGFLYAVVPYHLLQVYRMQLYSEFVAAAILPFCFLFATKVIKTERRFDVLGLSLSCSLLLLTHIPSSLIGLSGLAFYTAFLIDWKRPFRSIANVALAAILTILSNSFYLVRLLTEVKWVKHSSDEFSTGFFDFNRHLFPLLYSFGEDYWKEEKLAILDQTVILTILFFIPMVYCLVRIRSIDFKSNFEKRLFIAVSVAGVFSVFILSEASSFVWQAIPILQKIQFPWRFLLLASLIAVVSLTYGLSLILESKRISRPMIYLTISAVFLTLVFDATRAVWIPDRMPREEFNQRATANREKEGCSCWFPVWGEVAALESGEKARAENRTVEIKSWTDLTRTIILSAGDSKELRVGTFYYPYWKAEVNGQKAEVGKDANGAILLAVPTESVEVKLYFEEPRKVRFTKWLSLVFWILGLAGFVFSFGMRNRRRTTLVSNPTGNPQ